MENKIEKKLRVTTGLIRKTARKVAEQIKASDEYKDITLDDIDALQVEVPAAMPTNQALLLKNAVKAYLYIDKKNVPYKVEKLRDGFVGQVTTQNKLVTQQVSRGDPYGAVVSVPDGKGGIAIGASYFNLDEEDPTMIIPIIGERMALERALDNLALGRDGLKESTHKVSKAQIEHFYKRSLAYWNPDKYSFSRGSEPVQIDNFDEIHEAQTRILGEKKMREQMGRPARGDYGKFKLCGKFTPNDDASNIKLLDDLINGRVKKEKFDYYVFDTEITLKPNENFTTKTKSEIHVLPGDWVYYDGYNWVLIPEGLKDKKE